MKKHKNLLEQIDKTKSTNAATKIIPRNCSLPYLVLDSHYLVNPHAQTFFCTPTRKMTSKMVARDLRLSERLSCTRTSILCQKNHKTLLFLVDISKCPSNVHTIFKMSIQDILQNWYFFFWYFFFKCLYMSSKCIEMSFKNKKKFEHFENLQTWKFLK